MTIENFKKDNSHWSGFDYEIMSLALRLAKNGQYTARPNPMVGCVIVKDEQIVGQGWHKKFGENHAEANALDEAGKQTEGATCYVSLEPCNHSGKTGPCTRALIHAGVSKVIAAMSDPNPKVSGSGFQALSEAGIEVEFGLMEEQAKALNRGFISRFIRHRPWVTCKLAMSLDGRTALADGASQWITGQSARADVQKLRARQDAILTGSGTVLADNPSLTVRPEDAEVNGENWLLIAEKLDFEQPARIILDKHHSCHASAKVFNKNAKVYWFGDEFEEESTKDHVTSLPSVTSPEKLLNYCAKNTINNLLIEAGRNLAGEFLKNNLIDELVIYMAPKLMGSEGKGLFNLNIEHMADTKMLDLKDLRQFGDDIRFTYTLKN
jgi:diaminohydroxyphosphoribosylaminopyrimidine deaminase/5-amino-6-(5-phosphoribosylamino)uracil reductase